MANGKNILFIEKLIEETKIKKIKWDYLVNNEDLYRGMGWVRNKEEYDFFLDRVEKVLPGFDVENSFYTEINNINIVLLSKTKAPADLYVVPDTYRRSIRIPSKDFGEYITRLMNIVQSQFPNAADFMKSYLNDETYEL